VVFKQLLSALIITIVKIQHIHYVVQIFIRAY
jgi:hypothetical protein